MKIGAFVLLVTKGFSQLNKDIQAKIVKMALSKIRIPSPDFIVFDPEAEMEAEEDEGRSLRVPFLEIDEKVYAILDDHGSVEMLSMQLGQQVNTKYTITFLLASEY